MSDRSLILVDDDGEALISLSRALSASALGASIQAASSPDKALELLTASKPLVAVIDLSLEQTRGVESGFELLAQILKLDPTCRVIVLTGHGSLEHGVRAISLGAANFLEKPADINHLSALIKDGMAQAELRRSYNKLVRESASGISNLIVGNSPQIKKVIEAVQYASQTAQSVLITGETGTGKGLCALAIQRISSRAQQKFVRYQPNFSTADLVNSDLFGHVKGAFTGANQNRRGLLADADQGTLFLDEIDELPLETQVALLGVLQEKKYRPVGSNNEALSNFRLICATNQDPQKCIEAGKLRKDFYHRIAHYQIHLPALRERLEDIEPLALYVLSSLREREQVNVLEISQAALSKLISTEWPGNVRQLQSVIEGAAYRAQFQGRTQIDLSDLPFSAGQESAKATDFNSLLTEYKLNLISQALARHAGNQVKAAEELGLDRSTMRRILARAKK